MVRVNDVVVSGVSTDVIGVCGLSTDPTRVDRVEASSVVEGAVLEDIVGGDLRSMRDS